MKKKNQKNRKKLIKILSKIWGLNPKDTKTEIDAKNFLISGLYAAANIYKDTELSSDHFTLMILSMLESVNIPESALTPLDKENQWIQIAMEIQQDTILSTEGHRPK